MVKVLLAGILVFLVYSCGGGGSLSTSKELSVSFELKQKDVVVSVSDYRSETMDLVMSVSSNDIFKRSVYFDGVRLVYKDLNGQVIKQVVYPLGFSLSSGESRTEKLVLLSLQDKLSSPYVYLNDVNPSTVGLSYFEETLATPVVVVIGQGQCWIEQRCQIVGGNRVCQDVEVCRRDFMGAFPVDIQLGTCMVVAGDQKVQESILGAFSGDGSGVIQGRNVIVSFNRGVPHGVYVVAKCLSAIRPLSHSYVSLKLVYGDVLYESAGGNFLKNSSGVIVGEVDSLGNVYFYTSIGSKDYPLVAFYYRPSISGGELVGYGDGGSLYRLRTRYFPVDVSSVRVLAEGNNFSLMGQVQHVSGSTGEITVTFPRPVPEGVPIYAQYRLTDLFQRVEVYVDTSIGKHKAGEINLRVTK